MSTRIVDPTQSAPKPDRSAGRPRERSDMAIGELVASATADLSTLVKHELALAKIELKRDAIAAGTGAAMFAVAGGLALFAVIFISIAVAYALGRIVPLGTGFLIVGLGYLLVAAVLGFVGFKSVKKVKAPTRTIATVKDDIAWIKHPTVAPPSSAH